MRTFLRLIRDELKLTAELLVVLSKPLDEERLILDLKVLLRGRVLKRVGGPRLLFGEVKNFVCLKNVSESI